MDGGSIFTDEPVGAVIPSVSIANMLAKREAVVQRLGQIIALVAEAEELATSAGLGKMRWVMDGERWDCPARLLQDGFLDACIKRLDAGGWRTLLDQSGLRTFMDAKAREDWDKRLYDVKVPEFNAANIRATFGALYESRGDIFERGVINVFKELSWHYRTNKPQKLGKRLIITHVLNECIGKGGGYGSPCQRNVDKLDDLVRILHVLDGKTQPDHRQGMYCRISEATRAGQPGMEDEYMAIRWFRNGNGHVTFKRLDLVDSMNLILAKHHPNALPEAVA